MQILALQKSSKRNIKVGFTLIELLVVITIIAILIGVGTVSFAKIQEKGRDSKRKTDLKSTQQALELFYANYKAYPDEPPNDHLSCSIIVDSLNGNSVVPGHPTWYGRNYINDFSEKIHWGESFTCDGYTYLQKFPLDPIGNGWNKPGESPEEMGSVDDGYIYEVRQTSSDGWCVTQWGGKCKKYALWARLENANDPEKYVPGQDSTCDQILSGNSSMDYRWYSASATWYCVHSP